MLLRSSRSAERLTKEAGLIGRALIGAGKGIGKKLFSKKGLTLAGGAGMVGMTAAPMIQQGVQKSRVGLTPQYIQAQKYGLVPRMRA